MIAFLAYLKFECKLSGPSLIVAPLSVLSSWVNEFKRFAPTMRVVRLHSGDREERQPTHNAPPSPTPRTSPLQPLPPLAPPHLTSYPLATPLTGARAHA